MTTAIASQPIAPEADAEPYPPAPGRLIERFTAQLAEFPRSQMAPSNNPGYVAVLAKEQVQTIQKVLKEAGDYASQGHPTARDVAKSYRSAYALFSAVDVLNSAKKYDAISQLLQLGVFAGFSEDELRAHIAPQANTPEKQAALAATPADELRTHLLAKQLEQHPVLLNALRLGANEFDRQMIQHKLYSFRDMFNNAPGTQAQHAINHVQRAAIGTLGGGTALAWLGWISPEVAIGSALVGTAMSSGIWLAKQNTIFNEHHLAQLGKGLGELANVAGDLERAVNERETAEKAAAEGANKKSRSR